MNKTEEVLISVGFTRTEAKIYAAGLGLEPLTIQELVRKTKIKRPTVYHALGTLAGKGLVAEKKAGGKSRFSMCRPENIRGLLDLQKEELEERSRKLDDLIPLLAEQGKLGSREGVNVVQYSGIEGMKMVMDAAFYCVSRRWDIIAPFGNFLREYDKDYAERYLKARKYHGITSRTLWEDGMRTGKKLSAEEVRERNPRRMPAVMRGRFNSMMILFDDKIAIFSSYENLSAVLVTSKDLHALFQAMFDGLWESSERY